MKILIPIAILLVSCTARQNCPENINSLPMFGNVKKCDKQLEAEKRFLEDCEKKFKDRQEAAQYYIDKGWESLNKNMVDSAMLRFNQAWLLDSLNAESYRGFGCILGQNEDYKSSVFYFEKSLKLNPDNYFVWDCAGLSYGNLYFKTNNLSYLTQSIDCYKTSVSLNPENARAYAQLAASYASTEPDSARKYLKLAEKIDPKTVNPQIREMLKAK